MEVNIATLSTEVSTLKKNVNIQKYVFITTLVVGILGVLAAAIEMPFAFLYFESVAVALMTATGLSMAPIAVLMISVMLVPAILGILALTVSLIFFIVKKVNTKKLNQKEIEFVEAKIDKKATEKPENEELNDFPEGAPYKICENSRKFQYINRTRFYINNLYLATEGKSREGYGMVHTAHNSRYVSIQVFKMLYAVEYIGFLDKVKDKIEVLSSKTSSKIALFYREPGQSDYSKVTVIFSKFLLDDMINPNNNVVFYDLYMNKDRTISIKPKCLIPKNKILCGSV
jgi:hypothetical protein